MCTTGTERKMLKVVVFFVVASQFAMESAAFKATFAPNLQARSSVCSQERRNSRTWKSPSLINPRRLSCYSPTWVATAAADPIVVEAVGKQDVKRLKDVAAFFVGAFFQDYKAEATLSGQQLKRLGDEQFADMRQRYGDAIPLPSAMLVAQAGKDIVGCAGLEIALISQNNKILPKSRANIQAGYDARPLLANLAVAPEARRRGLARQLCLASEQEVLSWGYTELLLLVEAENLPALRLYRSLGYQEVWRDETALASKAIPYAGTAALQKVQVCNVAMRKDLAQRGGGLFSLFRFGR